jgi:uroporphyrin-3 C-methyltransferase
VSLPVPDSPAAVPPRRLPGALWVLLAIAALLAALFGWKTWSERLTRASPTVDLSNEALDARLLQVESVQENARRTQEAQEQRLVDTRARTGLLRDEVLSLTQRASLLEDSVRDAAVGSRDGVAALRLDEAELLLTIAQQRLELSGDLAGAVRATELAEGVLSTQRDPALLDLRQTLAQELAALRALPASPRAAAAGELDALEAMLPRLAANDSLGAGRVRSDETRAGGVQRLLDSLVQVRRSGGQDLLSPSDREAGGAALALELALARSALVGGDQAAFRRTIARIDGWLQRLYPDGAALRERRARLAKLRQLQLRYSLPIAGASLRQLQSLQHERRSRP